MGRGELLEYFERVREQSRAMVRPLAAADFRSQPRPEVSPPWWNLGHTSWFFARNLLQASGRGTSQDRSYDYLLNSYYESLGQRLARADRGTLSRPTNDEILDYRSSVDERVREFFATASDAEFAEYEPVIRIGIEHEQQHQELFYTEIKNIYFSHPASMRPVYSERTEPASNRPRKVEFMAFSGGLSEFGCVEKSWCWDNELGVHRQYVAGFELANRLVTNGEYLEFIEDGGYRNPMFWLADGWEWVRQSNCQAPMYWEESGPGDRSVWTLSDSRALDLNEPVCHLSFYEAAAFAQWASLESEWGAVRLPTEYEWEFAARSTQQTVERGNFVENRFFHPQSGPCDQGQMLGNLWEWTASHYQAYPGYQAFQGALSEYNGKFMNNQRVLRGGSCVTPRDHIRVSYRNFWPAETRFQFSGLRLARDSG